VLTDYVHTEDAVRLFLDEELDLTLSVQIRFSAGVGDEREAPDFISHALLLQVLLSLSDPCHLRVCIYYARDRVVVHMTVA
jgi:hypothetical protein